MSLVHESERNSCTWRRGDTFPSIRAAGKLIPVGDRAKTCLQEITPRVCVTPPVVRKFVRSAQPAVGAVRVFHGKANDPDIASAVVHGVSTKSSITAGLVINPAPKTRFQESLRHLQEINYATNRKAPLGRSQVQGPGLPSWIDPEKTTFEHERRYLEKPAPIHLHWFCVHPYKRSEWVPAFEYQLSSKYLHLCSVEGRSHTVSNAGEIINPPKTAHQVQMEAEDKHRLYIRSHGSYFVGERVDRKYNCDHFDTESHFGVPTPHRNDGRNISRCLHWLCDAQPNNSATLASKRCDDFREKTQPKTGKVHDPIAETLNVPKDHTFGVLMKPDGFGAGDLLHQTPPDEYLKGKDRPRTLLNAVRQHLKRSNYQNFSSLLEAFRFYDKTKRGKIDKEDLKEACRHFNMIISEPVLDDLMDHCDIDKDGLIDFLEFSNFLNWKDKMAINSAEQKILTGERMAWTTPADMQRAGLQVSDAVNVLMRPEDLEPVEVGCTRKTPKTLSRPRSVKDSFITSSSVINAVVGGHPTTNYQTCGVPSVRRDLAAPRIKRITDRRNYGDESTVYDLLHPPVYSLYGVYEEQLFGPREKDEIAQIFQKVGVRLSDEIFEEAWKLASMRHPTGDVCVEIFRNVLCELQTC